MRYNFISIFLICDNTNTNTTIFSPLTSLIHGKEKVEMQQEQLDKRGIDYNQGQPAFD